MLGLHKFVYILFVTYPLGSVNNYARTTWGSCLVLVIASSCAVVSLSKFVDDVSDTAEFLEESVQKVRNLQHQQ